MLVLKGEPFVEVFDDYVQMGCLRVSRSFVRELHRLSENGIRQLGTYETNDPNTRRTQ